MSGPAAALTVLLSGWFLALALVVFWKLLNGEINVAGMLNDQHGRLSPERVQLIIVTILGAAAYVHEAAVAELAGSAGPPALPDAPLALVVALGGSNAIYLVTKQLRFMTTGR